MSNTGTTIVTGQGIGGTTRALFGNVGLIRPDTMHGDADEKTYFSGPVPVKSAVSLLSEIRPVKGDVHVTYTDASGNRQVSSADAFAGIVNSTTGKVFSIPSSGYEPHDYAEWGISLTRRFSEADIDTVGWIRDGARAFVMFGADGVPNSAGYDCRPQMLFMSSLDGSLSSTHTEFLRAFICYNGVFSVESDANANRVAAKHTKHSVKNRSLTKYTATFGGLTRLAEDHAKQIEAWASTPITDAQLAAFMNEYAPIPADGSKHAVTAAETRRDALLTHYRNDTRQQWTGTLLGLMQAVNTYGQHTAIVRGSEDADRDALRQQRNIENLFSGKTEKTDRDAYTIATRVLATV